jgi:hypothetical protein
MFGSTKVKIEKQMWEKISKYAALAGYSSADEFVLHALEKELAIIEEAGSDEEIKNKLKGLGYIS